MNNANGFMPLLMVPLYWGPITASSPKESISAEQFISRVRELARQNGWDGPKTANMAMSFLRGEALSYFEGPATLFRTKDEIDAFSNDFEGGFLPVFRQKFGNLRAMSDLTSQWLKLKQLPTESPNQFLGRTSLALIHLLEIMPEVLTNGYPANSANLRAKVGDTAALVDEITQGKIDSILLGQRRANVMWRDLIISTLLIAGLRDPELANILQRATLKGRDLKALIQLVELTDRQSRSGDNPNPNQPTKAQGRNGNGNGRGTNGNGRNGKAAQPFQTDAVGRGKEPSSKKKGPKRDLSNYVCHNCYVKGHLRRDCRQPVRVDEVAEIPSRSQRTFFNCDDDEESAIQALLASQGGFHE